MEKTFEFKKAGKQIVTIDDKFIRITRKGILNAMSVGLSGEKAISLDTITSVQLKKPGLTSGYLQFSIPGGNETKGVFNAASDENTIMFVSKELSMAEEIRKIVEDYMANKKFNYTHSQPIQTVSLADELTKLATLRNNGILTEEEFQMQKQKLLSN